MRRIAAVLAAATIAAVVATGALAATEYAGPQEWIAGQGAGSSYSSSWRSNDFAKRTSGWPATVTFIDNVSYGWHATVRNTQLVTHTYWGDGATKKAHCVANASYVWGGCIVY
jgi:hypothetical protein